MKLVSLCVGVVMSATLLLAGGAFAQEGQDEGAVELAPGDSGVPVEPEDILPPEPEAPEGPVPDVEGTDPATDELMTEAPEDPDAISPFGIPAPGEPGPIQWGSIPDLPIVGVPEQGGWNYPPPVGELARTVHFLSHAIHVLMAAIVIFVLALIVIVVVRYNAKRNPNPARFTHNTKVEIAWTLVPVLILIVIGSFSLPVLFRQLNVPEDADLTVKVTGQQWFWTVEYPDYGIRYEVFMLQPDELADYGYSEDLYRLATDTAMVVPENATVRLQVTSSDVIHAWAMPSMASKMDGIPGRLNETWILPDRVGLYFGQCSELCGQGHAYMPITLAVVPQDDFEVWLDWAIDEYGGSRPEAEVAAAN